MNIIHKLTMAGVLTAVATTTTMATVLEWAPGGSSINWSDHYNWVTIDNGSPLQYLLPLTTSDVVNFEDELYALGFNPGWTTVPGAVNNIVDTSTSIGTLNYSAGAQTLDPTWPQNHFYTTLIPAGVTLTLGGSASGMVASLAVGDVPGTGSWADFSHAFTGQNLPTNVNYTTITGSGTLNVTNNTKQISVGWEDLATLDLTGLNQFNANVSQVFIGASPDNPLLLGPQGALLLAKTNMITTAPNLSGPGVLLGYATNSDSGTMGFAELGAMNTLNTDGLTVGGRRSVNATLSFGDAYVNAAPLPTFILRGSAGGTNNAIETFSMGDDSANFDGYADTTYPGYWSGRIFISAVGTADFSGGTVDILADNIIVGRNAMAPIPHGGFGGGILTVEHGTITATNVFLGQRLGTNASAANGTLTLKGDAVMNVVSNFTLGFCTNLIVSAAANGTLNVNDSAVLNVNGNLNTGYTNSGTTLNAINIGSGHINVGGLITNYPGSLLPVLTLAGGGIYASNGSTMNLNTLSGFGTLSNISTTTVTNAMALGLNGTAANGAARTPGTLVVGGNLTLSNNFALTFKLGSTLTPGGSVNDYLIISNNLNVASNKITPLFVGQPAVGAYDLIKYGGAQTGLFTLVYTNTPRNYTFTLDQATVPNHVMLNVAGGPPATLVWSGGTDGIWDTSRTNWNNNTDHFYTYDKVSFDDTGSQQIIGYSTTVVQGGMTFSNNNKTYTLYDGSSGIISGYGGLTKNGTGTLVLQMTRKANDFVGPININNGVIQDQSSISTSFSGQLFGSMNNAITIASGASLDLYGNNVGAILNNGNGPGVGYPVIFSGNGYGGIGAIANNSPFSSGADSSLYTPAATLADDASIGATSAGVNLTVSGTSPGATFNLAGKTLTTTGAGNVILRTLTATNSGNIQVNGPSLSLVDIQLGGAGTLTVGSRILGLGTLSGSGWTTTYGVSKQISIGGTIVAAGSNGLVIPVSSPITLTGNTTISNSQSINLSGVVSGSYGITEQGSADLIINNADIYTGPTIVNSGTLVLGSGGSLAASPLLRVDAGAFLDATPQPGSYAIPVGQTVQVDGTALGSFTAGHGATISGSGTYASSVTNNGGSLVPGQLYYPRTITFGSLTLQNASVTFDLDGPAVPGGNTNDLIACGNLSFIGVTTIKINPLGILSTNAGQRYTLFTYKTNAIGGTLPSSITNNLVLTDDSAYSFAFVDPATTPGSIQITASGGNRNFKVWQGGVTSSLTAWNFTTNNWLLSGSQTNFFNDDSVQFDDTGLTNVVNLVSSVRPITVTFSNNILPYTLQGPGALRADAITNSGTAGVTIANSTDNTLLGAGLIFRTNGTVTFNQPVNATFSGNLIGTNAGGLTKQGTNQLTLVGNNSATFNGPVTVNNGTLQAGGANVLGFGMVTVASGATADLNGQIMVSNTFALSGPGVGGLGALNNTGGQQTNAVQKIILQGGATIGAISRWDLVPGAANAFQGNSNNLTKVGSGSIFLGPKQNTSLSNINITAGELAFAWPGTDLGNTGSITVQSNATLAFAYDIAAGSKPTTVMPGGIIGAEFVQLATNLPAFGSNNSYAGDITFMSTGMVNIANSLAGLKLSGGLHGANGVVNAGRGLLTLAGSNNYSGDLTFNLGYGTIANSNALPPNTSVTLNCLGAPGLDSVGLTLTNNIATPASVPLNMISYMFSYNTASGFITPSLSGSGTWNGPINIIPMQTLPSGQGGSPIVNINGGSTKLVLNGAIAQAAGAQMALNFNGAMPGTIALNQPLAWGGKITVLDNYSTNTIGDASYCINTLELNAAGNSFTNFWLLRGKLRIGVDNAYPTACALDTSSGGIGYADLRQIIDLNGHWQTFSNITGTFTQTNGRWAHWIGNDSTTADATVIFDSSGKLTNTWACWICDNLNTNLSTPHKTGLTVASGGLRLLNTPTPTNFLNANITPSGPTNNSYTGNTLVSGGIFQVDAPLAGTAVTVSGSGTLAGTGPFSSAGSVTINNGGTLSPGGNPVLASAIGIMTNNGTLTLNAGGTTFLEVKITTNAVSTNITNDKVIGLNNMVYNGGTLLVTNTGTVAITTNSVFPIFSAAHYTAGAVTVLPASPAPGLAWDTSQLAVDGTLRVTAAVVNTTPPTLGRAVAAGNLIISWPADHTGWRLQVQTNQLGAGLKTNAWVNVPNTSTVTSVTNPIVSTNPTVFYRLVYP